MHEVLILKKLVVTYQINKGKTQFTRTILSNMLWAGGGEGGGDKFASLLPPNIHKSFKITITKSEQVISGNNNTHKTSQIQEKECV